MRYESGKIATSIRACADTGCIAGFFRSAEPISNVRPIDSPLRVLVANPTENASLSIQKAGEINVVTAENNILKLAPIHLNDDMRENLLSIRL
jgi:hypothetical protein